MTLFVQLRCQAADFSCVSPRGWGATTASAHPPTTLSIHERLGSKGRWGQCRDRDLYCLQGSAGPAPAAGAEEHGCSSVRGSSVTQQERHSPLLRMPSASSAEKAPLQSGVPSATQILSTAMASASLCRFFQNESNALN